MDLGELDSGVSMHSVPLPTSGTTTTLLPLSSAQQAPVIDQVPPMPYHMASMLGHWREYCASLDPTKVVKVSNVWSTIRAMQNQGLSRFVPNLIVNGISIVDSKDKADAFARHFVSVSDDSNYDEPFASIKKFMEINTARLLSKNELVGNGDLINTVFTYHELQRAIASVKFNTAPGPDKIPYSMLKKSHSRLLVQVAKVLQSYLDIWFLS